MKNKMPPDPFFAPIPTDPEEHDGSALQGIVTAFLIELAVIGLGWFVLHAWRLL